MQISGLLPDACKLRFADKGDKLMVFPRWKKSGKRWALNVSKLLVGERWRERHIEDVLRLKPYRRAYAGAAITSGGKNTGKHMLSSSTSSEQHWHVGNTLWSAVLPLPCSRFYGESTGMLKVSRTWTQAGEIAQPKRCRLSAVACWPHSI